MGYAIGQADNYKHLLNRLRQFAKGYAHAGKPSYAGVGNGLLNAVNTTATTVAETLTIACTAAAANSGTFSVTGSVTGAMGSATVGVSFVHANIEFKINDGSADFQVGDTFTIVISAGLPAGDQWVEDRYTTGSEDELIMHGIGDGTDEIYIGVSTFSSGSGAYYNWRLQGFTGFNNALAFAAQPGAMADQSPILPLWENATPYWFVADSRRIIVVAKVSTVYESAYLGFINPYASPNQYPYPLMIGGSRAFPGAEPAAGNVGYRWSSSDTNHRHPWEPVTSTTQTSAVDQNSQCRLRLSSGAWRGFYSGYSSGYSPSTFGFGNVTTNTGWSPPNVTHNGAGVWPGAGKPTTGEITVDQCLDGSPFLVPVVLFTSDANPADAIGLLGELSGVFALSGQGVAAEDIVQVGGVDYLVVQNVFRTTRSDYFAIELS